MLLQYTLRLCLVCGTKFRVKRCHQSDPQRGKFCSRTCSHKGKSRPTFDPWPDRFWAKVHKTDTCWLWTSASNGTGYGVYCLKFGTRPLLAHRIAWFLYYGEWPTENVLHRCDVRNCIRREHLFQGTQAENAADMAAKGRSTRGERNPQAKLAASDIIAIRSAFANGDAMMMIARRYGVSRTTIKAIINRYTWSHIA